MFHINFESSIPIYEQIERQAQYLIANGALPEGQLIPSVRELAKRLAINPLTVVKAYTALKNANLIHALRGQGYVVNEGAKKLCKRARLELFQNRVEDTLAEAAAGRLSLEDMREIVDAALAKIVEQYYPERKKGDQE